MGFGQVEPGCLDVNAKDIYFYRTVAELSRGCLSATVTDSVLMKNKSPSDF